MIASTARDYSGLIMYLDHKDVNANNTNSITYFVDVAIGASGSEIIIIPNFIQLIDYTQSYAMTTPSSFPIAIPAGTRISVRLQNSVASSAGRSLGFNLYGLYA